MLHNRYNNNQRESPQQRSKSPSKDSRNSHRKSANIPSIFAKDLDSQQKSGSIESGRFNYIQTHTSQTPRERTMNIKNNLKGKRPSPKKRLVLNI